MSVQLVNNLGGSGAQTTRLEHDGHSHSHGHDGDHGHTHEQLDHPGEPLTDP